MKKIKLLLFGTLFFLLFSCINVEADVVRCSYDWNGDIVVLESTTAAPDVLSRVVTTKYISIADGETIKLNNGQCPTVSFYPGTWVGTKIYSSQNACQNDDGVGHNAAICTATSGKDISSGSSSGATVGHNQAVITKKEKNFCEYKANGFTFNVKVRNGMSYLPDLTCTSNNPFGCSLNSDYTYFYGKTDSGFYCPQYIYYKCELFQDQDSCMIVGTGGDEDENKSGIESNVKGDKPSSGAPSPIETTPLDCDGLFSGEFGKFLKDAWRLIKFVVPILIIGLAIADFVKAISSQDENEIKKAANKLVKRLVIGVLLFVLPLIIDFLLNMAGIEFGTCDIR